MRKLVSDGEPWERKLPACLWLHFKGTAGKQVGCPVGKVRGSCCVGVHMWPGSKPGSRRSKGNLKITSHPNLSLSTRITAPGS